MTPEPHPPGHDGNGREHDGNGRHLADPIRRRRERRTLWQTTGERPMARNLAMIGALGWLVVAPILLGLFAGRWLDRALGWPESGIFWTASLLFVGVVVGCRLAWERIAKE